MTDDENDKCYECLVAIELDESIGVLPSADAEHERKVAIYDILEENSFEVIGRGPGPYKLVLSIKEKRLIFEVTNTDDKQVLVLVLSLSPFRRVIKDYFLICDSYFQAIRNSTPSQIETIDMARRALHNEGTDLLQARLSGKVTADYNTARRLFTLICALHWRG